MDFEFLLDFSRVWMEASKGAVRMVQERFLSTFFSSDIPYIDTVFTQRSKDKKKTKPVDGPGARLVEIPESIPIPEVPGVSPEIFFTPFQKMAAPAPVTEADTTRTTKARSFRAGDLSPFSDEERRTLSFGGGDWILTADTPRSQDKTSVTRPRVNWRVDTIPGQLLSRGIPMLLHWSGTLPTILGIVFQEVAPQLQGVSSAQVLRDLRILAMFFMLSFAPWHSLVENLMGLTFFEQTVFPRVWQTAFVVGRPAAQQIQRSPAGEPEPAPSATHAELRPEWILNWALKVCKEVGIRLCTSVF